MTNEQKNNLIKAGLNSQDASNIDWYNNRPLYIKTAKEATIFGLILACIVSAISFIIVTI